MPRRNSRKDEFNGHSTKRLDLSKSWTDALLKDLKKQSKKSSSKETNS